MADKMTLKEEEAQREAGLLVHYVHPEQGTDSTEAFSNGNTLPLTSMPFAMTSWALQTSSSGDRRSSRFFHSRATRIEGIRATHQPSPWIGDYGQFVVAPQMGKRRFGFGDGDCGMSCGFNR